MMITLPFEIAEISMLDDRCLSRGLWRRNCRRHKRPLRHSRPEPVQQIRLSLIEWPPLTPACRIGDWIVGVSVPPGGVAGFRIDRPVAAFDTSRGHVVHESVLPLGIDPGRDVTPPVAIANAGLAGWPVQVAAELADYHGVSLTFQITEVLLPTGLQL